LRATRTRYSRCILIACAFSCAHHAASSSASLSRSRATFFRRRRCSSLRVEGPRERTSGGVERRQKRT
jgi:hypothetical protein